MRVHKGCVQGRWLQGGPSATPLPRSERFPSGSGSPRGAWGGGRSRDLGSPHGVVRVGCLMPGLRWGLTGGMRYRVLRMRAHGLPSLALSIPRCAILAKALPSPRPQLACHRQGSPPEDGMKNTQKMDNTVPDV